MLDPVSQLVMGMIGGKTRSEVSKEVFVQLRRRFRRWENLRDADLSEVRRLIAPVTFPENKAFRLQAALRLITKSQGRLSLDLLKPMSVPTSLTWLEGLPGVGRKTAATVLNFSTLRKSALVVDSHHLRVAKRLGLIGLRDDTVEAYETLTPLMPVHWGALDIDNHHQFVKRHGQETCKAERPICGNCPLKEVCRTYATAFG